MNRSAAAVAGPRSSADSRRTEDARAARPIGWTLAILFAALASTCAVFLVDLFTGAEVSFSFLYLVSIAIASWFVGRRAGLVFALLSALGWVAAYWLAGRFYSQPRILYWNVGVELATFTTVALTLSGLRDGSLRQRALARSLDRAYRMLDREQERVGELQRALLPARSPDVPGYAIAIHYTPSMRAGGDYYDFFRLRDGRVGVIVADASGHGTPAAVVMAVARALLHVAPESPDRPDRTLASLNARLCDAMPLEAFTTACYAILDPATGRIAYALGGHNPPLLIRGADGSIEELSSPEGPPLGLWPDAAFRPMDATLASGDTLLLYTDGLTEATDRDGRLFGEEGLLPLLRAHRDERAESLLERVVGALRAHAGAWPTPDDVTMILIRANDGP